MLLTIGISHHTAPVGLRERFSISDARLYPLLDTLTGSPAIEEAVVLSTCNRTEFVLWTSNPVEAAQFVEDLLKREFQLKVHEARAFYRFAGDEAIRHIFRVTCSLDSMVVGEPEIVGQVKSAWKRSRQAGKSGRMLDALFQKALNVSKRARSETAISNTPVSVPQAAVALARQIFGTLEGRKVLIFGAGKMSELSARTLVSNGAKSIGVINRTYEHAQEFAAMLGGIAVRFEDRWKHLAEADIVISSTGCPHFIFCREDAERVREARRGHPVFLIDVAVPRDIDPAVRQLPGFYLYDIDDLQQVVTHNLQARQEAARQAEEIVAREVASFRHELEAERVVPTIVAVRAQLEELGRRELDRYRSEYGPLDPASEKAVEIVTARLMDGVAAQFARELKQVAEKPERDQLAAAMRRVFRLAAAST